MGANFGTTLVLAFVSSVKDSKSKMTTVRPVTVVPMLAPRVNGSICSNRRVKTEVVMEEDWTNMVIPAPSNVSVDVGGLVRGTNPREPVQPPRRPNQQGGSWFSSISMEYALVHEYLCFTEYLFFVKISPF